MPQPLPADWPSIKALNQSGVPLRQLAKSTGISLATLKARSAREGWQEAIKDALAIVAARATKAVATGQMKAVASATSCNLAAVTVADQGTLARRNLATAIVSGTDHLSKQSGAKVISKSRHLKDLAAAGSQVFGWDHGGASLRVNIYADLGSLRAAGDGPVIDV